MRGQLEEYTNLLKSLMDDEIAAWEQLAQSDDQFKRRTYVRTVFASIEGETFRRKQAALTWAELRQEILGVSSSREQLEKVTHVELTGAELALIREEQYELNNKGEARIGKKFLKAADNLRFSFKLYAKATNSSYELDVGGIGWYSFLKALAVRNRISHPKHERDLVITDEDLDSVQKAAEWHRDCAWELIKSAGSVQSGTQQNQGPGNAT